MLVYAGEVQNSNCDVQDKKVRFARVNKLELYITCINTSEAQTPTYLEVLLSISSCPNLVSGYECGRVFPAGVGPGSPSRDAAN